MGSQENKNRITLRHHTRIWVQLRCRGAYLDLPMNHSVPYCITLRTPVPSDVAMNSNEGKRWNHGYRLSNDSKLWDSTYELCSAEQQSRISKHMIATNKPGADSAQQRDRITWSDGIHPSRGFKSTFHTILQFLHVKRAVKHKLSHIDTRIANQFGKQWLCLFLYKHYI